MPLVDVRAVHKHYGNNHVLKGVTLTAKAGDVISLIGSSGSGKSTLLRCLNRLEEPSAGSIAVDGIDMLNPKTDINHARRRIGDEIEAPSAYFFARPVAHQDRYSRHRLAAWRKISQIAARSGRCLH